MMTTNTTKNINIKSYCFTCAVKKYKESQIAHFSPFDFSVSYHFHDIIKRTKNVRTLYDCLKTETKMYFHAFSFSAAT